MLAEHIPLPGTDTAPVSLQTGDVVRFHFPVVDAEDRRDKPRPCLVLDTLHFDGHRFVMLAYGTLAEHGHTTGYDVPVCEPETMREAGLSRPTRFCGARCILVSVRHPGFGRVRPGRTPRIGCLIGKALERMNAVRGRLHAEADIAQEQCDKRMEERKTVVVFKTRSNTRGAAQVR